MVETTILILLGVAAGFTAGCVYFEGLWRSVRVLRALQTTPTRRLQADRLYRSMPLFLVLTMASLSGLVPLVATLCGVLAARTLLIGMILWGGIRC